MRVLTNIFRRGAVFYHRQVVPKDLVAITNCRELKLSLRTRCPHLALAQQHHQRAALAIAHGMQLGVQAALGAPDTSGNSPFLSRLAAVRCALRCVASIINRSGLGPLLASSAKIRLNTPSRL